MPKFVPRQRKHKVLARERAQENARHVVEDSNQAELPSHAVSRAAADERKKKLMKEELKQGAKVTGKKAKRLEKYIDSKLRKDENRDLLSQLAEKKVDTSLFSSTRNLGSGHETKKQKLARALREQRASLDGDHDELLLQRQAKEKDGEDDDDASDASSIASSSHEETSASEAKSLEAKPSDVSEPKTAPVAGGGLKRPLEVDDDGRPVIPKRQKRGGVKSKISARLAAPQPPPPVEESDDASSDEWGGISDEEGDEDMDDDRSDAASSEEEESSEGKESEEAGGSSSSEESSGEDDESEEEDEDEGAPRVSAFKAWAHQKRNEALGYTPSDPATTNLTIPKLENFTPRPPEQDPLPQELMPTKATDRQVYSVSVDRLPEIQEARMKLPVVAEEQRLMEAIHNNDIVVVCGATGSGKTTQVPQFLFEAGYGSPDSPTPGMVGITQPRRVAAVSMSKRVAEELGNHSEKVAYQIRFEGTVDSKTAVKFMTDGVLLREIAQDFALRKYSAIIIDEAHERSVNTDILIGMLSRVIKLRSELAGEDPKVKPLKLIIMSATLRIEDLTMNPRLFSTPPPVLEVEGRQYPVTMHFSRRTSHDYVEEAFKKICRGHKKLPPGGFLVFLTGRNEIMQLSKKLKEAFPGPKTVDGPRVRLKTNEVALEVEDLELGDVDENMRDDFDDIPSDDENAEDEDEFEIEDDQEAGPLKMQVLPLYSLLPTREQMRVFQTPPEGTRQVIVATNVAETSLTIPGTRFVFDCGRSKERQYDAITGVQSYQIGWISKASANQRSGRAGRTGPGHCYRLYSSAVYERDFSAFADPEILRMPIEGVVLHLKSMNLQKVVNFPFPTPPDRQKLAKAEKLLEYLAAVTPEGQVTEVGNTMSVFPLAPRLARILLLGHLHDCTHYAIILVAALSLPDIFLPEAQVLPTIVPSEEEGSFKTNADHIAMTQREEVRKRFNSVHRNFCFLDDKSDAMKLLQVSGEYAHEPTEAWCQSHFVRFKVLQEVSNLRRQLADLLRSNIAQFAALGHQDKLPPPTAKQVSALKQMTAVGFIDQVAIRADLAPTPPEQWRKPKRSIDVPYLPLIPLDASSAEDIDRVVYIHPTSPLAHLSTQECPQYIIYSHLQRSTPSGPDVEKKGKIRMHALTDVSGSQLSALAQGTPLLSYGKPIKEVKAASVGAGGAMTRECWVVPYLRAEQNGGGMGWPLPAKKVKQRKVPGKGWVVE